MPVISADYSHPDRRKHLLHELLRDSARRQQVRRSQRQVCGMRLAWRVACVIASYPPASTADNMDSPVGEVTRRVARGRHVTDNRLSCHKACFCYWRSATKPASLNGKDKRRPVTDNMKYRELMMGACSWTWRGSCSREAPSALFF